MGFRYNFFIFYFNVRFDYRFILYFLIIFLYCIRIRNVVCGDIVKSFIIKILFLNGIIRILVFEVVIGFCCWFYF